MFLFGASVKRDAVVLSVLGAEWCVACFGCR